MKISVVVPAYNEEKYLPRTLESLKKQSLLPDEIIVINASSTDKTEDVALENGAIVYTCPKTAIGFSRQLGIVKSKGDIVIQTDADAILPNNWVEKIASHLQNKKNIGYFGGFRIKDGPLWYRMYINLIQPVSNTIIYFLFKIPFATGQNMGFWRDEALKCGGIPENFKIAEDIEIARRIQKNHRIFYTQKDYVIASGRRGYEKGIFIRVLKVFFYYFLYHKGDKIGFPDIR